MLRFLSDDLSGVLIAAQRNEFDVAYVACVCPLEELEGRDQLWFDPDAFGQPTSFRRKKRCGDHEEGRGKEEEKYQAKFIETQNAT
jgi:hypothetical protein